MISPSSITFRTSAVEIIRSGRDIWRTACGKKSIRCEARSRINCRKSMLFFVPQVRMVIDVEREAKGRAEGASQRPQGANLSVRLGRMLRALCELLRSANRNAISLIDCKGIVLWIATM